MTIETRANTNNYTIRYASHPEEHQITSARGSMKSSILKIFINTGIQQESSIIADLPPTYSDQFLTLLEASDNLKMPIQAVEDLVRIGVLPVNHDGNEPRISIQVVTQYQQRRQERNRHLQELIHLSEEYGLYK